MSVTNLNQEMNKFIWEKQNSLTSEFCKNVIYKFERDLRKSSGTTIGGHNTNSKRSTDLSITNLKGWEEEDKIFYSSLSLGIYEYRKFLSKKPFCKNSGIEYWDLIDTGYQIQRTIGGKEYYNWHHDFHIENNSIRLITFIWYLNTIDGPGGETEFIDKTNIKPEEGKLIFFPSTWDFVHRGKVPPKGSIKYLCTGWLYIKI